MRLSPGMCLHVPERLNCSSISCWLADRLWNTYVKIGQYIHFFHPLIQDIRLPVKIAYELVRF